MNQWIDWNQFVTHVTQKAMEVEESLVKDQNLIEGVRTNERAAAIFNMMQNVMGLDNFDEGIQQFVKSL